MGKSTISMAIFNSKLLVYQRVFSPCSDRAFFASRFCKRNVLSFESKWVFFPSKFQNLWFLGIQGHALQKKICCPMDQRCEVRVGRAMLANKHSGCSARCALAQPEHTIYLGKNVFTHQQNEDLVGFNGFLRFLPAGKWTVCYGTSAVLHRLPSGHLGYYAFRIRIRNAARHSGANRWCEDGWKSKQLNMVIFPLKIVIFHDFPIKNGDFPSLYGIIVLYIIWLVVWNMNSMTLHILGMSSSQLTNSIIFQRGRYTTNQMMNDVSKELYFISDHFQDHPDAFYFLNMEKPTSKGYIPGIYQVYIATPLGI